MASTQDESYYILDMTDDVRVYLGVRDGAGRDGMFGGLRCANQTDRKDLRERKLLFDAMIYLKGLMGSEAVRSQKKPSVSQGRSSGIRMGRGTVGGCAGYRLALPHARLEPRRALPYATTVASVTRSLDGAAT